MLAANEAVGDSFQRRSEPVLWRIHDAPDAAKLETFASLAQSYGLPFDLDEARTPKGLGQLLERLKGHPAEKPLSFQLLRSLKQASYDMVNVGHFGLASQAYIHFTSPIRRYPDVVAHRRLKQRLALLGKPAGGFAAPPTARRRRRELAGAGHGGGRVLVRRAQGDGDRARGDRPVPGVLHARPGGRRVRAGPSRR